MTLRRPACTTGLILIAAICIGSSVTAQKPNKVPFNVSVYQSGMDQYNKKQYLRASQNLYAYYKFGMRGQPKEFVELVWDAYIYADKQVIAQITGKPIESKGLGLTGNKPALPRWPPRR